MLNLYKGDCQYVGKSPNRRNKRMPLCLCLIIKDFLVIVQLAIYLTKIYSQLIDCCSMVLFCVSAEKKKLLFNLDVFEDFAHEHRCPYEPNCSA